jgi:hypothetical protein
MIEKLLNLFKKEEKQQETINYIVKTKTVYPENYPQNGNSNERFAYYAKNSELIPLTK